MRAPFVLAAMALLTSCQSPAEKAEGDYNFLVGNRASEAELCRAAGRVAQAYMDQRNQYDYQLWAVRRDLHCDQARLNRL